MATSIDVPVLDRDALLPERDRGIKQWPKLAWRFARKKPLGAFGALIIILMLVAAVFVDGAIVGSDKPLLAPSGFNDQNIREFNQDPSWAHPLGTDELGRDIFSRILYGARISAVIGLSSVTIVVIISMLFGTISGYFSGWIDTVMQRIIDILLSIPPLILLIFAISVFAGRSGPYGRMLWIVLVVAFVLSAAAIRVVRSAAIATANTQYVEAARALGAGHWRIMLWHIMPNVLPVAIVLATVNLGVAILAEAAVSFLGYGIPSPFPSWGAMLNITGASQFRVEPLQAVWPGLAIALAVYGFNMFGDALRDVLDPRLRGGA